MRAQTRQRARTQATKRRERRKTSKFASRDIAARQKRTNTRGATFFFSPHRVAACIAAIAEIAVAFLFVVALAVEVAVRRRAAILRYRTLGHCEGEDKSERCQSRVENGTWNTGINGKRRKERHVPSISDNNRKMKSNIINRKKKFRNRRKSRA